MYAKYWFQPEDEAGTPILTGVRAFIFDAGTVTLSTIVGDLVGTAKANSITPAQYATDGGKVVFYAAPGGSYDVFVVTNDGKQGRVNAVSEVSPKRLVVPNTMARHRIFPFGNANTVETDSGLDLIKNEVVRDVLVEVVTNAGSATVDVGILSTEANGDLDGFADAVSAAAVGFIRPGVVHAGGANLDFVSAVTRGVLLGGFLVGADAVATGGYYAEKPYRCDGVAKSLVYNSSNHAIAGYIHVFSDVGYGAF